MKLTAHYIAVSNGGSKLLAVFRGCKKTFVTIGCILRLNKINEISFVYITEKLVFFAYVQSIPTNMRDL